MPKQNNETYLDYKKRVIDIKSESWCAAKWYNATIWLGSGQTTSCHHPLPHHVSEQEVMSNPRALHNTSHKKAERKQMQQGERPRGCEYCWKIEDADVNNVSDRVYKTVIYDDKDLEYAFNLPSDSDVNLQTLEISFDRTCQFACSYCNPAFSSTWVRDIKNNGPYVNLVSDGRNHFTHTHDSSQLYKFGEENPYITAFFNWWESDLHKSLKELRITGGEPLMSGYTWKLLDWYTSNDNKSSTKLAINSNLGFDEGRLKEFLDKVEGIPHLEIYTSNESVGPQAEYIRDGLDYNQWLKNLELLVRNKTIKGVHVMCTINALCLDSLPDFLTKLLEFKSNFGKDSINFTLNILRFPSFQSALVLPDDIKSKYKGRLQHWLDIWQNHVGLHEHEIAHVKRLINYLDRVETPHSEAFELSKLRMDFKNFYSQYDQRRGKDFAVSFPSLVEWYNTL
jgi:organic radical activating enzyme